MEILTKFCMKFFLIMKGVTMSFFLKIRQGKWRDSPCSFLNFSELWLIYCSTRSTNKFYKIWPIINYTAHRMSRYTTYIVTYVFEASQNPHFFPPGTASTENLKTHSISRSIPYYCVLCPLHCWWCSALFPHLLCQ
jgi:hypothetical protein